MNEDVLQAISGVSVSAKANLRYNYPGIYEWMRAINYVACSYTERFIMVSL